MAQLAAQALQTLTGTEMAQRAANRIDDCALYAAVADEIADWGEARGATREEAVAVAFNSQFFGDRVISRLLCGMVTDEYNARLGERGETQLPKVWVCKSIFGQDEYDDPGDFARRVVQLTSEGHRVTTETMRAGAR